MSIVDLDYDWKAKKARDYFEITWNGLDGLGVSSGKKNLDVLH